MVLCVDGSFAHYWIIETPNGTQSYGGCQKCGAEKIFSNWIDNPHINLEREQIDRLMPWRDVRAKWRLPSRRR
jgi:NMD protein affecting ribosome stability and mRNA decay